MQSDGGRDMTRRLYAHEALEVFETVFEVFPDSESETQMEGTIANAGITEAQTEIDFWLDMLGAQIDPQSIVLTPDHIDDGDMPAVRVVIKLEAE